MLFGAVAAPLCLGAGLTGALGVTWSTGRRAFLACSYLVGHLVLAPLTYLWLLGGKPVPGLALPILAAAAGGLLLARQARRRTGPVGSSPPDWLGAAAAVICCAFFANMCVSTNMSPIVAGDEALIWSSKARVLYATSDFAIGAGLANDVGHAAYPLLNPLIQTLAFASAGGVVPFESRIPIQAFSLCLILLLSASLSRRAPRIVAIATVVAFTGASSFVASGTTACADAMLAFSVLLAGHSWLRFHETGDAAHWRVLCLALAATVATKNEGYMLAVVLGIGLGPFLLVARPRRSIGAQWLWLAAPSAAVALGLWFNSHYGLVTDLVDPNRGDGMGLLERSIRRLPERAGTVAAFYRDAIIGPESRWIVLLALLGAAVTCVRDLRRPVVPLALVVAGGLTAYMLVFVGTTSPLEWHLLTAAHRTILHVTPLAALVLGLSCAASAAAVKAGRAPPCPDSARPDPRR